MNIIDLATKTLQLAIQTAVNGVKTVVDATKTKVDTIDTRTTTINTNVNTVNTNLTSTKTVVDTINTNVSAVNTNVDTVKTNLATVDSLVDDLITRLGAQASTASNTTSSNAHSKLNWLLTNLATVNTNTATANLGTATATASNATSAVAHAKINYLLSKIDEAAIGTVGFLGVSITNLPTSSSILVEPYVASKGNGHYTSEATNLTHSITGKGYVKHIVMSGSNTSTSRMKVVIDETIEITFGGAYSAVLNGDIPFKSSVKIYNSASGGGSTGIIYEMI